MEKIGFIGLGIMGKPMSKHLIKAGYQLFVLSTSKAASELKQEGATLCGNIAELASQCDVVITMVPDSPEVKAVVEDGVMSSLRKGSLFVDMSTIDPAVSVDIFEKFKAKGVEALDAPVSGGQGGAEGATLSIMVGGTQGGFERAKPIFEKMGKNIVHIGKAGAGQICKACNQVVVGMNIQAVAEALTLAKKSNVDVAKVRTALLGGFAQSKILDVYGQRILDSNFKPGFRINLHRKDMKIVLQAAKNLGMPLPGASVVASQMDALIADGKGEMDNSALALLMQKMAGL